MKPVRSVSASHLFAAQRYDAIASFHQKTIESLPGLSLIHTIYNIYIYIIRSTIKGYVYKACGLPIPSGYLTIVYTVLSFGGIHTIYIYN